MHTIIFATNNEHKIKEIQSLVGSDFTIITLQEAGIDIDIPEPHDTLQENAYEKAITIETITKQNCFSEDTGLEIEALNGEPGVKSARYAGGDRNFQANIDKVLEKLNGSTHRKAQFRTVICLLWNKEVFYFEGICKGTIAETMHGAEGFGYDPIFYITEYQCTAAQLPATIKNTISHRSKALSQLRTLSPNLS